MAETRWERARAEERAAGQGGYGAHFARLIDEGVDIEGEARLADVLAPRGGRILDAGSGMGRVGGALAARGHRVVGVDFDPEILEQSRRTYPDLPLVD
jgi:2-polyprenyl-3-methyl-5-hydroxy-6-metoxy-1,4-benzoquinol methylase